MPFAMMGTEIGFLCAQLLLALFGVHIAKGAAFALWLELKYITFM